MEVWVANYDDGMYPEDNFILGVYMSEELAEKAIMDHISFYNNKNLHLAQRLYYNISSHWVAA